jgi:hypothetical protein
LVVVVILSITLFFVMQIDARGKRLVIRWKKDGKPYSISFAGCNNPLGRLRVEQKAKEIQLDIDAGYFDRTLLKYKPPKLGENPTAVTAVELFQKYIEHQQGEGAILAPPRYTRGLKLPKNRVSVTGLSKSLVDRSCELATRPTIEIAPD